MNIQVATCKGDLCAALMRADIAVPARTAGRETSHRETYTISHLLSTLAYQNQLSYPLSVTHSDKPDFLLEMDATKIGVEVTEAIPPNFAEYCVLAAREFPGTSLEPAHFRWGAPTRAVDEIRELLRQGQGQGQLTSDGWVGDHPEQEWTHSISSVVNTKLAKLAQSDFETFDNNWLSIYDNLPLPHLNLENAVAMLQPKLQDRWSLVPAFDTLFVEHGPVIVKITAGGSEFLALNDLWKRIPSCRARSQIILSQARLYLSKTFGRALTKRILKP